MNFINKPTKLLNEQCDSDDLSVINESAEQGGALYIEGPFIGAEKQNRNGRTYPLHVIEREVKKYNKLIASRESLGELNHPENSEINPERAAILITKLQMDGNFGVGKAKILSTPCGQIFKSLITDGVKMGVSTRGTGNLTNESIVCDDYNLITIDAVYMPSCQDAYVNAVNECTKWVLDESTNLYLERKVIVDEAQQDFQQKLDNQGSKAIASAFVDFIKEISRESCSDAHVC